VADLQENRHNSDPKIIGPRHRMTLGVGQTNRKVKRPEKTNRERLKIKKKRIQTGKMTQRNGEV